MSYGLGVVNGSDPYTSYPSITSYPEDDPWYIDAGKWAIDHLCFWCGDDDAKTWQEHYAKQWTGSPCPGAPDPRRAAVAAAVAPAEAEKIRKLLQEGNSGWAPTVQEMAVPDYALLWVNAAMGGDDCVSTRFPQLTGMLQNFVLQYGGGAGTPQVDPAWPERIYEVSATGGPEAGEELLRYAAEKVVGAIPEAWREALERGVQDYYAGSYTSRVKTAAVAAGPWVAVALGVGLVLALGKRGAL